VNKKKPGFIPASFKNNLFAQSGASACIGQKNHIAAFKSK
jgi:hypothetical protein